MASLAAGIVDPTKAGKYPVVLSDALLGKDPKEVYTGVRYNHKPSLSSSTAPHQARIKPTSSSSNNNKKGASSYDLSFQDDGGRYAYNGTRGNEDSKYVLIFDPAREVFVLHKVDSMFNMNLVRTPSSADAETLRHEHPQLESHKESGTSAKGGKASAKGKTGKAGAGNKETTTKARKQPAPKEDKKKNPALSMPEKKAAPPKPEPKPSSRPSPESEEDESDDDDLGLTIEDPGGAAPSASRDFSPGFLDKPRRLTEFMEQHNNEEEGDDDADGEEDDDDAFEHFTLPSPINRQMQQGNSGGGAGAQSMQVDDDGDEEEEEEEEEEEMEDVRQEDPAGEGVDDMALDELDLEAALMAELGEGDSEKEESDVSEEE